MTTLKTEPLTKTGGVEIPGTGTTLDSIFCGVATSVASEGAADLPVLVISQSGVPRWVIPENARRAIGVLASWKPYRLNSRAQWSAIVSACRLNLLGALPGVRREMLRVNPDYWSRSIPGYSESWSIVVYIGNPFPTRKALLFLVDKDARVQAVVKTPIYPAAKAAILNEANILAKLRQRLPLPRVLFVDEQEGIAGQSWVEGVSLPRIFRAEHLELLTRLASEEVRVRLSDWREPLADRIARTRPPVDPTLLDRALSLLESRDEMKSCVEHGDFTPWNLRRLEDGRLTLIDWEWAVEAGLPWQDVCRYFYLQDYLFREGANVWKILMNHPLLAEYRLRLKLTPEMVRGLTARFLLRFLCDEHEEGNRDKMEYATRKLDEIFGSPQ